LSLTTEEGYGTYASESFWGGVMVFNVTFNNISVISWRKLEYPEKTTDLPQITDKLFHIMHCWGEEGTNSLIISSACLIYICWLYAYWTVYLSFKYSFEHTCGWGISECLYNPWNRHLTFELILTNIPMKSKKITIYILLNYQRSSMFFQHTIHGT
jgi:hypothetical protein